ncbi:MAG: hypothetical protein Q9181_007506, partial [Wetmoreana brouardii]
MATTSNEHASDDLWREYDVYKRRGVASSPYIRSLVDVVGDVEELQRGKGGCLVLEWLESTLGELSPDDFRNNTTFLKAFFRAGLSAIETFQDEGLVNTDGKPYRAQSLAVRAPEVHEGRACSHPAQVWSLAATLIEWMKPGLLGHGLSEIERDKAYRIVPVSWGIARFMRLFPDWVGRPRDYVYEAELNLGRALATNAEPMLEVSPLEVEMQEM